jgi:electron transport complex protein RnfC
VNLLHNIHGLFDPASWFRRSFPHGIHPEENKFYTEDKPIRRLPFPPRLILPLAQHTGAPSIPLVHAGQEVVRGEPIAEAGGFVSVPLHAPATGVIRGIEKMPTTKGNLTPSIILEVYPGDSQEVRYSAPCDIDSMSTKDLISAVQATGLVGLGGAAFPTHVKLSPPKDHRVHTVLINGCECEPFLTTDYRVMIEDGANLVKGTQIFMKALGAERGIIGVEDNKLAAAEALQPHLPADGSVTVKVVKTKYPQGAEKMLAKAILGVEIPSGSYPSSVGLAVFNVSSTAQVGELLPHSRGVIERVVTITGPGVEKPGNYLVPIGTTVRFILEQIGFRGREQTLIMGGPMMGSTVASADVPVTKGCGGFLVLTEAELKQQTTQSLYPCISCGHCVEACPMILNPAEMGRLAYKHRYQEMQDNYNLNDCFECGCCSFVCPAGIPLVQYFRVAKSSNRSRARQEQLAKEKEEKEQDRKGKVGV